MAYPWEQPPPVYQYVGDAHNTFMAKGDELVNKATQYAEQLANFGNYVRPTVMPASFEFNGLLGAFERPEKPVFDEEAFAVTPVEAVPLPPSFAGQAVDLPAIPEFTATPPVSMMPAQPTRPLVALPTPPPRPVLPALPDEPDFTSLTPAPVTLVELNIPAFQPLNLPEFTAARPEFNPPQLSQEGWSFTPEEYVSALLEKIQGRVSRWLDGEEALPAAIERALYDRGRARVEVEVDEAVEQAWNDFAGRGFSAPPGMLAGRIDTLRFNGEWRIAEFNTTATVKSFDEALANMRLAVQSGIQLEGLTSNLHIESQRLLLASAQHLRDTGMALLNAAVAEFNALNAGYQTDASVFETRLKAALSVLDEARLRLEGEKLKGEINDQSVRAYAAAWEGVRSAAQIYESRVRAMTAHSEALKIPIEIFAKETEAFEAVWSAHGKEWDGYRAAAEADSTKAVFYRAMTEAHTARVQGVVAVGGLGIENEKLRIAQHGQNLSAYDSGIRRVLAMMEQERTRLTAVGQKVQAQATIYRADADVETAASAATDRTFQLGLAKAQSESEANRDTARIKSQENVQLLQLLLEAQKTLATIFTQLGSSTMSAMNYSAGISGSISSGYSLTESREL